MTTPKPAATRELPAGTLIGERYRVLGCIGRGGAAIVYLCVHTSLHTEHAIKVVKYVSPSIARRLLHEGRAQASLVHPNIVHATDTIEVEGAPALVMAYVRGPALDSLLRRVRLSVPQIDSLARGLLDGVGAAHARGVVHRDLKPANILLDVTGGEPVVKIADFGLVKVMQGSTPPLVRTRPGTAMGTPEYMAPEQIRSARDVDLRADVFSLGAILYEMVTGAGCFQAEDLLDLYHSITRADYTPVRVLAPGTPMRMVRAIESALQPDPDARCPSAAALAALWFDGATPSENAWNDPVFKRAVGRWTDPGVAAPVPGHTLPPEAEPIPLVRTSRRTPSLQSFHRSPAHGTPTMWRIAGAAVATATLIVGLTAAFLLREAPLAPPPPRAPVEAATLVAPTLVAPTAEAPPIEVSPPARRPVAAPPATVEAPPAAVEPPPAEETRTRRPLLRRNREPRNP